MWGLDDFVDEVMRMGVVGGGSLLGGGGFCVDMAVDV